MPTYEYKCKDCSEGFEVVQAFTDDALTECPSCHGSLKKVFGAIGISFKGSGFYKNDARGGSKATTSADGSSSSTDSGGSDGSSSDTSSSTTSDNKTESKPAPKKEPAKKSEKSSA